MRDTVVRYRKAVRPLRRAPRPGPPQPMFRSFPYWRRAKRIYVEHWIAAAILILAFANAARLLASG
jgi:hypothetical protein